ncbi:hypothetical protein ACROYT_G007690 [Oculina patagonica]
MLRAFIVFFLVECSLTKWCPENIHFTNSSGDFSSPKPDKALLYPDNVRCIWRITISDTNQQIKLSFNKFHLENCDDCACDFVEIFDVVGPKQNLLGRFCGRSLPGPFYSSKQSLLVVFQSDHGNGFAGFTASYSSVLPGAVCRNATRLVTAVGSIHSPEFPSRNYPTNVDCVWQITTPYNTRMRLKVQTLSIQSCGEWGTPEFCSCDYLEIRDGSSSGDRLLATFCGTKVPDALYSSGRHLWVRFKSDGQVVASGFVASFSSETIREGVSCPASWKYPFKCPQELNINRNKTGTCCYDDGPNCCEPGGKRCSDSGSSERDYCPRPGDDKKLKYCCTKKGLPSCCESSGVYHKARFIVLLGVIAHVSCVLGKWYNVI